MFHIIVIIIILKFKHLKNLNMINLEKHLDMIKNKLNK